MRTNSACAVVFYKDQAVRPVCSENVYVLKASWIWEDIGGQNIRKTTLDALNKLREDLG